MLIVLATKKSKCPSSSFTGYPGGHAEVDRLLLGMQRQGAVKDEDGSCSRRPSWLLHQPELCLAEDE